jgi:hypothetical protein
MSVWNPLIDDGDLFRLAVAIPAVNLQEIVSSISRSSQDNLEIRCAVVREAFVQAVAAMAVEPCPSEQIGPVGLEIDVGENHQ